MGYGNQDEGCISSVDRKSFFTNFRDMLSCRENTNFEELSEAQSLCFKVINQSMPPAGVFRKNEGIFTGLSLRYLTSKISPQECVANINRIKDQFNLS